MSACKHDRLYKAEDGVYACDRCGLHFERFVIEEFRPVVAERTTTAAAQREPDDIGRPWCVCPSKSCIFHGSTCKPTLQVAAPSTKEEP